MPTSPRSPWGKTRAEREADRVNGGASGSVIAADIDAFARRRAAGVDASKLHSRQLRQLRLPLQPRLLTPHERHLLRTYRVSPEEYAERLAAQDGVCAICRQPERFYRHGRLSVDHDHVTGRVRGLLCSGCNTALGSLGDDPARLRAAAAYLESQ